MLAKSAASRSGMNVHGMWLMAAGLLLAASGCGGFAGHSPEGGAAAADEGHVVVRVQPAEKRSMTRIVTALGRCEALPEKLALLTPAVEGQVKAILVKQGQHVTAGQAIVQFDSTLANADLAEKKAARDSQAASLKLLKSRPRPEEQAAGKLAIEQAKVAVARADALVQRLRPLRARNEVSEQQLFDAEQALAHARLQQQTAEAQLEALLLGPREEAIAEAQTKIQIAEEAVGLSQARLELHTIKAPLEGVLDSLTCSPGQTIAIGTSMGVVVDNRQVLATAWLPVSRGQQVHVGQAASVRVAAPTSATAAKTEDERELAGQVVYVGRVADAQTGNMPVRVLVENSHDELVVGQTIALSILVEQPEATLAVPAAAVHDEGEGSAITVVRGGKAVVLHSQLGAAAEGWVAVSGTDLKEGEPVIVAGAYNLPDGTAVKVESAPRGAKTDDK